MKKFYLLLLCCLFLSPSLFAQINSGKKILIVCTSSDKDLKWGQPGWGCYMPEVTDFYSTIYKFGFRTENIDIVSPEGGVVPLIYTSPTDRQIPTPAGEEAKLMVKLNNSLTPDDIKPEDYNAIFYAGGYSCLSDYPTNAKIANIAAKIYENNGVVGLVCDGIVGLIPIKLSNGQYLVNGKNITTNGGYTMADDGLEVEQVLNNNGANIENKNVVVDGRLITARNVQPIPVAIETMVLLGFGRFPTSVANVNTHDKLTVYPIPANDRIYFSDKVSGHLSDIGGRVVLTFNNTLSLDVAALDAGVYFIGTTQSGVKKIVIE